MPGEMVHIEIPAEDVAAGRAFWGSLFGWEFTAYPGPFEYHMARLAENQSAALMSAEPGTSGPRAYFDVDDIGASVARVRELGGEAADAAPVPAHGWFAACTDPQGNQFGLWQTDPDAPNPAE